jgi:hypothetical protein
MILKWARKYIIFRMKARRREREKGEKEKRRRGEKERFR